MNIFLLLIIIFIIFIIKKKDYFTNIKKKLKFAIHTVFIAKENILFFEQWIDYHKKIGFEYFYLYDNSKVNKVIGFDEKNKHLKLNKVNKYGIKYDNIIKINDKIIKKKIDNICKKYKNIKIIEWSPKDKNGNIGYFQTRAHKHCLEQLKRDNIDWCANIDMDEFIVLNKNISIKDYIISLPIFNNISNIKLSQIRFDSRFNNLNNLIININKKEINNISRHKSNKNIYKISKTTRMGVHDWFGIGKSINPPVNIICFNHYKLNCKNYKYFNNINNNLKKKIIYSSKKYIII
jgi:hypothetical protein